MRNRLTGRGSTKLSARAAVRLGGGGLLLLLLALAAYTQNTYWASQALLAAVAVRVVTIGYVATGFIGWRAGVPIFSLLFITTIPAVEELLGLEEHSRGALGAEALLLLAAGLAAFAFTSGAAAALGSRRASRSPGALVPKVLAPPQTFTWLLLGLGAWGIGYSMAYGYYGGTELAGTGVLSGIANAAAAFFSAGLAGAWTESMTTGSKRWLRIATVGTALHALVGLLSASKGAALFPLLVPFFCYVNVRAAVPWKPVAIVLAAYVLVVFPFATYWRAELGTGGRSRADFARQGIEILLEGAWFGNDDLQTKAVRSGSRGLASVYGTIVRETGVTASREDGATYLLGLGIMVPRLLWPEKPDHSGANLVGKKYGIISEFDDATGIAPTWAGEAAMNFGPWGIPVVFALLGLLAAWIDGPLTRRAGLWFAAWMAPVAIFGQEGLVAGALLPGLRNALVAIILLALVQRLGLQETRGVSSGALSRVAKGQPT